MSKNLRECMKKMQLVCANKCPKLKKSVLKEMSKNELYFNALFEIIHNISHNKLKLKPSDKKKLKKFLKYMEKIARKPKSKRSRALLVKQSGGFLPIILPIVASAVTELISYAIRKKSDSNSS